MTKTASPLVSYSVSRAVEDGKKNDNSHKIKCPFGNREAISFDIYEGGCVWLSGNSGLGKTTLAMNLAGLSNDRKLIQMGMVVERREWDDSIPMGERCGVLFQQTTLLDSLTVAGNVYLALAACPSHREQQKQNTHKSTSVSDYTSITQRRVKELLETVGLDHARDGGKRVTELSGGMARRASLALQLAQRKRLIVLDEPFAGLDYASSVSVAKELFRLRRCSTSHMAYLLISHEPHLANIVMNGTINDLAINGNAGTTSATTNNHTQSSNHPNSNQSHGKNNTVITLTPPTETTTPPHHTPHRHLYYGTTALQRFLSKLYDYLFYSLPLILLAFLACGLAISMLSSDMLRRIDVTDQVLAIVDTEVRPLLKLIMGSENAGNNPLTLMMIKMRVRSMLNTAVPPLKAKLYAVGMAKLFVLEIGPLLTALLLCGRIGGSYAGEVGTMQATSQTALLRTLGLSPQTFTLLPAICATLLASPLLTLCGTTLAIALGGLVGPMYYGVGERDTYFTDVWESTFPPINVSYSTSLMDVITYPPFFHVTKSLVYGAIVILVAEAVPRLQPNLTPRHIPHVITSSVVIASVLVIVADWGFSQLYFRRTW